MFVIFHIGMYLVYSSYGTVVRDFESEAKTRCNFQSDKLGGIDFTKFSKLSMCSAGAGWYNGLGFLIGTAHGQF